MPCVSMALLFMSLVLVWTAVWWLSWWYSASLRVPYMDAPLSTYYQSRYDSGPCYGTHEAIGYGMWYSQNILCSGPMAARGRTVYGYRALVKASHAVPMVDTRYSR